MLHYAFSVLVFTLFHNKALFEQDKSARGILPELRDARVQATSPPAGRLQRVLFPEEGQPEFVSCDNQLLTAPFFAFAFPSQHPSPLVTVPNLPQSWTKSSVLTHVYEVVKVRPH